MTKDEIIAVLLSDFVDNHFIYGDEDHVCENDRHSSDRVDYTVQKILSEELGRDVLIKKIKQRQELI